MLESNLSNLMLPKDLKLISIKNITYGYLWEVEKIRQDFEICPKCAQPSSVQAGKRVVKAQDEGLRDTRVYLLIHKHRYYCKACRKTFTEPVSIVWPRRRTTQRFRKTLARSCHNFSNLSKVRNKLKVSSGLMYKVYFEQIEQKLKERKGLHWPEVLGIDEHFFSRKRGFRDFVTMFCDLKKKRVFEVALGRSNTELIKQMDKIPGRLKVKYVAIDMSGTYKSFVQKMFPNAKIISDKFHVLRLLNPAIMSAGKNIHGHRQELKTRRRLLMSRTNLDYWVRSEIDIYLKDKPELNELYRFKEKLFELYRTYGENKARSKLELLINQMKLSKLEAINKLGKTLNKWKEEVLFYFKYKLTNAFTEAMNNTGKLVQKQGYGYKSFVNYRLRLLSACFF